MAAFGFEGARSFFQIMLQHQTSQCNGTTTIRCCEVEDSMLLLHAHDSEWAKCIDFASERKGGNGEQPKIHDLMVHIRDAVAKQHALLDAAFFR